MNFMPKASRILGEEGIHFPNAYVTTPMCCPSRSSSLTGLYVHNHNVYTNNDNCSSQHWQTTYETRTFATYLSNAGYRTAFFGKYLNEYNGSYIPQGWKEWSALVRNSRFYNYTLNVNGNKVKHGDDYHLDYYPDLITNDSLQFLRYSKRFFANKPLLMVLSYPGPHGPEEAAPQFQNLFMNVTTHRTPSWNFAPNPDKQWLMRITGKMEPIHEEFTDLLHTRRLQTLQSIDEAVEKLYNELKELGELDNTYIVYTSDHGYHLGQFGLVKGKAMPFEFDVRVPFYVRGPKLTGGQKIDNIVLNIDLAPTFLDIAGVKAPDHMDGSSFLPILKNTYKTELLNKSDGETTHQKINWRHTFLIERGKSMRDLNYNLRTLTKKEWLTIECQKPEYQSPCGPYQRFECFFDGYEMRIRKCRKTLWDHSYEDKAHKKCICPEDQPTHAFDDQNFEDNSELSSDPFINVNKRRLNTNEKKLQRRFLKEHVINKDFRPTFIESRNKRDLDFSIVETFDVEGVYELSKLLDASTSKMFNESTIFEDNFDDIDDKNSTLCTVSSNLSISCSDEVYQNKHLWKQKKNRLDSIIKKLQNKLTELKGIRRHLNMKRPLLQGLDSIGSDHNGCDCNVNRDNRSHHRRDKYWKRQFSKYSKRKRIRFMDKEWRREKKMRRKNKFLNTTCNYEKMNCFTHDNQHWKTAPLWTKGPFCFCQNSNNNSFWCLRTINSTHNFLYCEFVTGFITYYNLLRDPYQLKNAIYDLEFSTLEDLRRQLNKLKTCVGAKQCTLPVRKHYNNHIIDDSANMSGISISNNFSAKSRSERKIIS
ncbi:putative extracellular sulfatase Sulf-1 homolog isoform X2 [Oppia nitens]|nr:putative extracellular sulfatase Sulf-1 homolog isoform X2 [Oppia nitens]